MFKVEFAKEPSKAPENTFIINSIFEYFQNKKIMAINSKRANEITAYINEHEKCIRGKQKVEIGGKIKALESFMIPIDKLLYNHDNRRFNIEIQEHEAEIKRQLDPTDKADAEAIKKLLLYENVKSEELNGEAKKLYSDLLLVGEQRDVAHITHDGIVVNGNRRMATLELLHKKQPTGKWTELWAVRLPPDISEKDLWKIEAGLQLAKDKVAEYGPVNNLLMIHEGKRAGLTNAEIAASMYGWSEKMVEYDLERLKLIDTFLSYFGQSQNYGLIKRFELHEHFIDIQKGLAEKLKKLGMPRKELVKKLEVVFHFLKASILDKDFRFTHMDAREICKILMDEEAAYTLTDSFADYEKKNKAIPHSKLTDNFDRASDVRKNREDKGKPTKLIDKAITALKGIDKKGVHYKQDDVRKKLKELIEIISKMKSDLGIK